MNDIVLYTLDYGNRRGQLPSIFSFPGKPVQDIKYTRTSGTNETIDLFDTYIYIYPMFIILYPVDEPRSLRLLVPIGLVYASWY